MNRNNINILTIIPIDILKIIKKIYDEINEPKYKLYNDIKGIYKCKIICYNDNECYITYLLNNKYNKLSGVYWCRLCGENIKISYDWDDKKNEIINYKKYDCC